MDESPLFRRSDSVEGDVRPFEELRLRIEEPDWSGWTEGEFEERALAAFRHQYETCAPYRALCTRRGVAPDTIVSWEDAPAVPATAFKYFDFVSVHEGDAADPASAGLFLTSGTTQGRESRGRHHVPSLDLYRASLAEPFRRALLPAVAPAEPPAASVLSLIPSPDATPRSSLSFMVGAAAERFARRVVWLVDGDGRWRPEGVAVLEDEVAAAEEREAPLLVLGTALSFVHLRDALESRDRPSRDDPTIAGQLARGMAGLPGWARAMETGGFKGSHRSVTRDDLHAGIEATTGITRDRIVNEYGMTELLSQSYDGPEGLHRPPPWLKVRALDPDDLTPMPEGKEGILAFFDLANLGSVCHVLTEDVGSIHDGGLRLQGRAAGAEPRGCSRALDDLMTAARG